VTALIVLALTLVAVAGTAVVLADAPERQAVTLSVFGLALVVVFMVLEAPDVALSELGVGTAIVPLMVMLAVRTMRKDRRQRSDGADGGDGGDDS
jgi:energy-converting hydrogenase B subunit D